MSERWPGGLISRSAPVVVGGSAPGIWTINQIAPYIKGGTWPQLPGAPTIGTATAGSSSASVTFTAPSNLGVPAVITSYIVTSSPGGITGTGASSPVTVSGLTNGTAYTFTVQAINAAGTGPASEASNSVTPTIPNDIYAWGQNSVGQLGQNNSGSLNNRSSPVQVGALSNWATPASGFDSSLAIKTNGTLWGWGYNNNYGQLGQGDTINRSSPVQVGALTNWLIISAGQYFSVAIKTDGTLWSWGQNNRGQLGQNISYSTNKSSPNQVGLLTTWSKVACGTDFVGAIKTDGTLWSWGYNGYGQLGLGSTTDKSSPNQVGALTTWASVSCGYGHMLAVKTDGTLWTWGRNSGGQLGLGNTTYYSSPKQVGALTNWSKTANGPSYFSLAIKTNGTLWSWGENTYGELGLGNQTNYSSPKQVGALTTWASFSTGSNFTAAIKTDKTLWTCGTNDAGRLGLNLGSTYYATTLQQVGSEATWSKVSCGYGFVLSVKG